MVVGDVKQRVYFVEVDKVYKVGLDTKRVFPNLAGKMVPYVTVIFRKGEVPEILQVRVDPAYINPEGQWKITDFEHRCAASAMEKIFDGLVENTKDKKVSRISYRPVRIMLTDNQKELIKVRIDKDFGVGIWNSLPPHLKMDLWKKGIGFR